MISWIIYLIVALILCFILYIAFQGISRGIEAKNNNNELFLIISSRAFSALNQDQKDKLLESYKDIIHSDIPTIEKYGGGSARCMLTELF